MMITSIYYWYLSATDRADRRWHIQSGLFCFAFSTISDTGYVLRKLSNLFFYSRHKIQNNTTHISKKGIDHYFVVSSVVLSFEMQTISPNLYHCMMRLFSFLVLLIFFFSFLSSFDVCLVYQAITMLSDEKDSYQTIETQSMVDKDSSADHHDRRESPVVRPMMFLGIAFLMGMATFMHTSYHTRALYSRLQNLEESFIQHKPHPAAIAQEKVEEGVPLRSLALGEKCTSDSQCGRYGQIVCKPYSTCEFAG